MAGASEGSAAVHWIDRALGIRRRALELEPENVVVQRELAIALLQRAELAHDDSAFAEGAALIVELKRRGVLEAQYEPLAQKLPGRFTAPEEPAPP